MRPLVPQDFLQNKNTANLILKATKRMIVDDPAIFILWNPTGFNDTPLANCRNGILGQHKALLSSTL